MDGVVAWGAEVNLSDGSSAGALASDKGVISLAPGTEDSIVDIGTQTIGASNDCTGGTTPSASHVDDAIFKASTVPDAIRFSNSSHPWEGNDILKIRITAFQLAMNEVSTYLPTFLAFTSADDTVALLIHDNLYSHQSYAAVMFCCWLLTYFFEVP